MQDEAEMDKESLRKEAEAFKKKQELDKLNLLIEIDQEGTMKNTMRKPTSTIDILGTKANKKAKDLGFEVVPTKKEAPLKSK